MGGSNAPYMYDRPQSWNFAGPTQYGFNPKAATQASWSPKPQRPQQKGPLVDFNTHPDSYLQVPYGNLKAQPMPPSTKSRVVRVRSCLLALRWTAMLAALGSLFCIIAIKGTGTAASWIIRVAPAAAVAHTFYAIYHLSRSVTSRTPGSTASYMIFSGLFDLGLLPFCGFSAYMAYLDYAQNAYGWSTLFNNDDITYKIILAFFILSSTLGGVLAVSLLLTVWLAITFRKITKLPPDMNPLEENLTSRFAHKRNKSSMNITEKHMSASTLAAKRQSNISGRRVPYMHSRTDSADSVTLYGTESARYSRIDMRKGFDEVTKDPYRVSVNSLPGSPLRPDTTHSPAPNSRPAGSGLDYRPGRVAALNSSPQRSPDRSPERPSSWLSYLDYEGQPTELSQVAQNELDNVVRPISPVSAISSTPAHGPLTHTWSNRPSFDDDHSPTRNDIKGDIPHAAALMGSPLQPPTKRSREPLAMNPPTPVRADFDMNDENYYGDTNSPYTRDPNSSPVRPVLQSGNGNSRPSSFIGSGTKGRFYGDLRASIGSVGLEPGYAHDAHSSNGFDQPDHNRLGVPGQGVDRSQTTKSAQSASDYSGNFEVYDSDDNEEPIPALPPQYIYQQQSPYGSRVSLHLPSNADHYSPTPPPPQQQQQSPSRKPVPTTRTYESPRQTSNSTGLDLHGGYVGLDPDFGKGMARRRDVSGKVAEEGRGGIYSWDSKACEQVNLNIDEVTPKKLQDGYQSAGWARFKGL